MMTAKDDPSIDWAAVDWHGKGTVQIALELGSTPPRVSYRRKIYAPETVTRRTPIDWKQVDWARPSGDIAKSLGVSTVVVSRNRRIHAPETLNQFYKVMLEWENVDWSKEQVNHHTLGGEKRVSRNRHPVSTYLCPPHTGPHSPPSPQPQRPSGC